MMILFGVSLMVISRIFPPSNHHVNGDIPAEKPEDKSCTQREETLLKRVARLENDVQAANDDSTAWMERYHEQCSKNHSQSLQIERAATSLGSRLTYLDLKAQIQSLEIKCNSLGSDLRDSERSYSMLKDYQKQKQGRLVATISTLQGRITRQVRHGRKRVPNTVRATELKREKAESAILRDVIAKKDRELRAATDRMSHLESESAQIQASSDKVKRGLDEELIQKNHEIAKLRGKAAKKDRELRAATDRMSHLEAESAQNQTSFNKVKRDLDEELIEKNNEIRMLQEKATEDMSISRAFISKLEQQLGAKTQEIERSHAALSEKRAELESLNQKATSFEARDEAMEVETLAPTPSELAPTPSDPAPTASEGMDIDSEQQLHIESQSQALNKQREQIEGLEQGNRDLSDRLRSLGRSADSEIEALKKRITELTEIVHEYRNRDHDMTDASAADGRVGEVTESYSQTMKMQKDELARLQKENERLKAIVGQDQSLERGGRELADAKIARLQKEKDEMNTNLQKARKLADNLKKERDQHRQAKTTLAHENSELTKSQRQNVEELKKLGEQKAKLVAKCASLQNYVDLLTPPDPNSTNDRKRSASDDEEGDEIQKRVKRDQPDSSNA